VKQIGWLFSYSVLTLCSCYNIYHAIAEGTVKGLSKSLSRMTVISRTTSPFDFYLNIACYCAFLVIGIIGVARILRRK